MKIKNKNWDAEGNWIGDDLPDSIRDWSIKTRDTASMGDFVQAAIRILVPIIIIAIDTAIGLGLLWLGLWVLGVV